MKIRLNLKYAMAMMGMVLIAACTDDDDWQAGPQAKDGCQQVHFSGSNETFAVLDDSDPDDRMVTLTVERNTSEGALTVPVAIEKQSEGISIPTEVNFEDGQTQTELTITVTEEAQKGKSYEYVLQLTGDETDPYTQLDGSARWSGGISFPLPRRAKMWLADWSNNMIKVKDIGMWETTVLDMGNGRCRIEDLMNTGMQLDIIAAGKQEGINDIVLSSPWWYDYNIEEDSYYPGCYYYFCNYWDDAIGGYVYYPFYPGNTGAPTWITQIIFYAGPGYSEYYYDPEDEDESATTYNSYYQIVCSTLQWNNEAAPQYWNGRLYFKYLRDSETVPTVPKEPGEYNVRMWLSYDESSTIGNAWNATLTINRDGSYSFNNLMGSGIDLNISTDDSYNMTFSSPQWEEANIVADEDEPGNYFYYFNTKNEETGGYDYYPFYPYGRDNETYISELMIYSGAGYSTYNTSYGNFFIYLPWVKLSNETAARTGVYMNFRFEQ